MEEGWFKLFGGIAEILFGVWIIFTATVVLPLLIKVAEETTIARFFYSLGTAVCAIYFTSSGVAKIFGKNNDKTKTKK